MALSLQNLQWTPVSSEEDIAVVGRSDHSATLHPRSGNIYIFGGRTSFGGLSSELLVFDTSTNRWVGARRPTQGTQSGQWPAPRAGHAAAIVPSSAKFIMDSGDTASTGRRPYMVDGVCPARTKIFRFSPLAGFAAVRRQVAHTWRGTSSVQTPEWAERSESR